MGVSIVGPAALNGKNEGWQLLYRGTNISIPENSGSGDKLDTYNLPGGLLGLNSIIKVSFFVRAGSGGQIDPKVHWDTNSIIFKGVAADNLILNYSYIWNDNSLTAQRGPAATAFDDQIAEAGASVTYNEDTTAPVELSFRCTTAAGETGTCDWWMVEVLL